MSATAFPSAKSNDTDLSSHHLGHSSPGTDARKPPVLPKGRSEKSSGSQQQRLSHEQSGGGRVDNDPKGVRGQQRSLSPDDDAARKRRSDPGMKPGTSGFLVARHQDDGGGGGANRLTGSKIVPLDRKLGGTNVDKKLSAAGNHLSLQQNRKYTVYPSGYSVAEEYLHQGVWSAIANVSIDRYKTLTNGLDTSFIKPDAINNLGSLTQMQKLAMLNQSLKFRNYVVALGKAVEGSTLGYFKNKDALLGVLNNDIDKLTRDPSVQSYFQKNLVDATKTSAGMVDLFGSLRDGYNADIVNGGIFAKFRQAGLSATESMRAYNIIVAQYAKFLPAKTLGLGAGAAADALSKFIQNSTAPTGPAAYDALLNAPPPSEVLPEDVTYAFGRLGPDGLAYMHALGPSVAAEADQLFAQFPPGSFTDPKGARQAMVNDTVAMAVQGYRSLRFGANLEAAQAAVRDAIAREPIGSFGKFLKTPDSARVALFKTGLMHMTNSLLLGAQTAAKFGQEGSLSVASGAALISQGMSVSGLMLEGLGKNLGMPNPLFGNAFKSALTRYISPKDLENAGATLGGFASVAGAAVSFISAAKSGSQDIANTVLSSISGANGVLAGAAALGEAALYYTDGTPEAAAGIGRLLGFEAGEAALETLPALGFAVAWAATSVIGVALAFGTAIYDIVKQTKEDKNIQREVVEPLHNLTGMYIDLVPNLPGGSP